MKSKRLIHGLSYTLRLVVTIVLAIYISRTVYHFDLYQQTKLEMAIAAVLLLLLPWEFLGKAVSRIWSALLSWIKTSYARLASFVASVIEREEQNSLRFRSSGVLRWIGLTAACYIANTLIVYWIPLPYGYYGHVALDTLVVILAVLTIRQIIRSVLPNSFVQADAKAFEGFENRFIKAPSIARIAMYIITVAIMILALELFITNEAHSIAWTVGEVPTLDYSPGASPLHRLESHITLDELDLKMLQMHGKIYINQTDGRTVNDLARINTIVINYQLIPLQPGLVDYKDAKVGTKDFTIRLTGNTFFFPFSNYESGLDLIPPASTSKDPLLPMDTYIGVGPSTLELAKHNDTSFDYSEPGLPMYRCYFRITYSPYYKALALTVLFILVVFLVAIWRSTRMENIISLSIGIFASIFAVRTYMVPQEVQSLNTPLLIDQVILIYIVIFLACLLYKFVNLADK